MDPATIQGVVKRLLERALIQARPDPSDRRRSLWRLSPAGKRLIRRVIPIAERITAETLAPLGNREQKTFLNLLKKLS